MKRIGVILLLSLIASVAAANEAEWVLFIRTQPFGATVRVNGAPAANATPVVLRGSDSATLDLVIDKPGYLTDRVSVSVVPGSRIGLDRELQIDGIALGLPGASTILVNGIPAETESGVLHLSGDRFMVDGSGEQLSLVTAPRLQRLGDALNIAVPIMVGFGAVLTIDAAVNPPDEGRAISAPVIVMHGITASLIGLDIGVHVMKAQQAQETRIAAGALGNPELERATMQEADDLIGSGELERALDRYDQLLVSFPESTRVPEALFRSAGALVLMGNPGEAQTRFLRVVQESPVSTYYDVSLKNLADLEVQSGNYPEALGYIGQITFFESPYTRDELSGYVQEVIEIWSLTNDIAADDARTIVPHLMGN